MAFKNVSVVARNGIPLISVDGEIVAGMAFTLLPERRTPQYVKRLVEEAGIKMWFPIIICEWPGYESEKQYDFSAIEMILAADPDAMLIPRFALMPPESWKMKFPAEMAVAGKYSKKTVTPYYSIASELWLRSSQEVLEKLISTLEQHRCAQNVIGIFTGIGSHFNILARIDIQIHIFLNGIPTDRIDRHLNNFLHLYHFQFLGTLTCFNFGKIE